jgi:hypothetical protein
MVLGTLHKSSCRSLHLGLQVVHGPVVLVAVRVRVRVRVMDN